MTLPKPLDPARKPLSALGLVWAVSLLTPSPFTFAAPSKLTGPWAASAWLDELLQSVQPSPQSSSQPKAPAKLETALRSLDATRKALAENQLESAQKHWQRLQKEQPAHGDPFWGALQDHREATQAGLEFSQAGAALEKKQWALVMRHAQNSITHSLKLLESFPQSPDTKEASTQIAQAELLQARAHSAQKKPDRARTLYEQAFQRLDQTKSFDLLSPAVLVDYARLCAPVAPAPCELWLQRLSPSFPAASAEARALSEGFSGFARLPSAPRPSRVTTNYKATDLDQAAFEPLLSDVIQGREKSAIRGLRRWLDEFPASPLRHRARFWLGELLQQRDDEDQARLLWRQLLKESPYSYYGLLAATRLQLNPNQVIDAAFPMANRRDPYLQPAELQRLERAERFLQASAPTLAAIELKDWKPRDAFSQGFVVYLASLQSAVGNHSAAFTWITELLQRGAPAALTSTIARQIFPVVHWSLIQEQARAAGLDPVLVLSLMKQESGFAAEAASSVGASGLMQLMHATAIETDPAVLRSQLTVPAINVRIGTRYLKKMLDRYNGNIALALAAYNAGPGATDRWVREGRATDGLLKFIEQIPYKETRDYVGSILRNHHWYSQRLSESGPQSLSYFWTTPSTGTNAPKR